MNASRKFPQSRLRRTRFTASIRNLIAENDLTVNDLIQPIFVKEGLDGFEAINSLPGINRYGLNALDLEIEKIQNNKINAVATIILSAIGSNNSPNLDSSPSIRANIPSKKSVNEATINNIKAVKSP